MQNIMLQQATNSPSPVSSDSFPENEVLNQFGDDHFLEDGLGNPEPEQDNANPSGKRKSRRPPSTAERRATHNAVERARRESLNGRFMDLAGALPNMATVKRPSKSVIVAKSLEFVQGAQAREQYLMGQNDSLRQEINDLRARLGMAPLANSPPVNMPAANLPMVNRTRKASSVSSNETGGSPHMSTPSSLGSFDASPATASFAFNPAYNNAFPSNAQQQPPMTQINVPPKENNTTPTPVTVAPYARPSPALDVNYLMALSMQQQQQQQHHLMNMNNGMAPHHQPQQFAPWLMPRHAAPVAAGGESHWLFN